MMPASPHEPGRGPPHLMEALDRVLDRGIVIDAEMRFNVAGLNVAGVEARIVVAAIETYRDYADDIALTAPASWRTIRTTPEPLRRADAMGLAGTDWGATWATWGRLPGWEGIRERR